jgi:2-oxoglutarate ferredoxin oxidoreductase subunit delta
MWAGFAKLCKGCGLCIEKCPKKCLSWSEELGIYGTPRVEPDMKECTLCGICDLYCPDCAILIEKNKK